jgi:multidrug efflux system membrane fusion protein
MTANVAVLSQSSAGVALVPLTAIYRDDGDRPAVWLYDPQTQQVQLHPVSIAQYREDGALLRDGVRDGEWIVAAGVHKLKQNQKVRPYDSGAAAANDVPPGPGARERLRT